jgi:CDGSH-type Zn-finger protein
MDISKMKIKILKNGPYIVSGNIPLSEKIITPKGKGYEWKDGRPLPQAATYSLCRCGKTKNPPFCDGAHIESGFRGDETAGRSLFEERSEVICGPEIDLLDDHRCALARFCHREQGDAWELTVNSGDPHLRDEAIEAARECPAGRLVARYKTGELIEPEYEPAVEIIQDPEEEVSGGIFVKGGIPLESSDGEVYETQNRIVLCRCGHSEIKPFCDAAHILFGYLDSK